MTVNRIAPPFPVSDTGQPWPSPIVVNFEVVERVVEVELSSSEPLIFLDNKETDTYGLFAAWNDEDFNINIVFNPDVSNNLPADFIIWGVNSPPSIVNNTLSYTFTYSNFGLKVFTINFPSLNKIKTVYLEVPDVGSVSELEASVQDPLAASYMVIYSSYASDWEDENISLGYFKANALKHSYWNALMASTPAFGRSVAIWFSTAHEFSNKENNGLANDTVMDLHNNEIGSHVIHYNDILGGPDAADLQTIKNELMQKLNSGELWSIENNSPLIKKTNNEDIY